MFGFPTGGAQRKRRRKGGCQVPGDAAELVFLQFRDRSNSGPFECKQALTHSSMGSIDSQVGNLCSSDAGRGKNPTTIAKLLREGQPGFGLSQIPLREPSPGDLAPRHGAMWRVGIPVADTEGEQMPPMKFSCAKRVWTSPRAAAALTQPGARVHAHAPPFIPVPHPPRPRRDRCMSCAIGPAHADGFFWYPFIHIQAAPEPAAQAMATSRR